MYLVIDKDGFRGPLRFDSKELAEEAKRQMDDYAGRPRYMVEKSS